MNVQSYYSFLNSTLSIEAIVQWAVRHELPALALADDGNLHGAVEFVLAARKAGIKPILGARVRVGGLPVLLYVENDRGYSNLCRLLSGTSVRARQGIPERLPLIPAFSPSGGEGARRADEGVVANSEAAGECTLAELEGLTEGLLAVSSNRLLAPFFPGRFYFPVNSRAAMRSAPSEWPCAAALPGRYAVPEDRWKFNIAQAIRTLTLLDQEHPDKIMRGQLHLRTPAEMQTLFRDHPQLLAHTAEVAERCTFDFLLRPPQFPAYPAPDGLSPREFLRRLVFEGLARRYAQSRISTLKSQIETELGIIAEVGYEEYFLVVWDLLQDCRREGIEWITRGSAADSLVCYCLGISGVCPVRFDLYFRRFLNKDRMALNKLPDIDIDFAHDRKDDVVDLLFKKHGAEHCAMVGGFSTFQARSAFAEVAKVLGVAEREVRRFTDKFPWSFGGGWSPADHSASERGLRLKEMLQANPECGDLPLTEPPYASALEMAEFLDGFPRHPKMHPCGVVLSRQPMHELTPTFQSNKGRPTTHFDMDAVEAAGLVKLDILAQGGLAALRDTKQFLATRGIEVDLEHCVIKRRPLVPAFVPSRREGKTSNLEFRTLNFERPQGDSAFKVRGSKVQGSKLQACKPALSPALSPRERERLSRHQQNFQGQQEKIRASSRRLLQADNTSPPSTSAFCILPSTFPHEPWHDPQVWEMIARGEARAVHHIESPAMIGLARQCNVQEIDGLIAIVSVIRPGAANDGKKRAFTRRYQGLEPVTYPHPSLEACLRSTYGLVVYEEHILQICEAFAGLPPGRADVLRRALGKQKREMIEEIRLEFLAAARARGHSEEKIQEVWDLVGDFAGYAFCKAHSTAYGVEAYQAAWLKKYFPVEFMAAVLSNGKGFYHPLVYVLECHRLGITLRPPAVNQPGPQFLPDHESKTIGVPIRYIKGLTERTNDRILEARNRAPFATLADFYRRVNPSPEEMEALLRVGALDEFGQTRAAQYWHCQFLQNALGSGLDSRQDWLLPAPGMERLPEVPLEEPTRRERLQTEADLLGFPVSGHPLELHDDIAWDTYCPVAQLGKHIGREVVTCGLVIEQRTHHQVTGEAMKFLTLADWTGMVETELFAQTYRSYGLATVRYPVLEITATVEPFDNGRGHSMRVHRAGKPRLRENGKPAVTPAP